MGGKTAGRRPAAGGDTVSGQKGGTLQRGVQKRGSFRALSRRRKKEGERKGAGARCTLQVLLERLSEAWLRAGWGNEALEAALEKKSGLNTLGTDCAAGRRAAAPPTASAACQRTADACASARHRYRAQAVVRGRQPGRLPVTGGPPAAPAHPEAATAPPRPPEKLLP